MADKPLIAPYTIVGKVLTWMRSEIIKVNSFVNNIKTVEQSPTVQTIEQLLFPLLETAFPAAHIPSVIAIVVKWFKAGQSLSNSAAIEVGKTDLQVAQDAISALQKLKNSDPDAYAIFLHSLNVYITAKYTTEQGTPISVEDAIASVPLVYASEKAAAATIPASTATVVTKLVPPATPEEVATLHSGFDTTSKDAQGELVNSFTGTPN